MKDYIFQIGEKVKKIGQFGCMEISDRFQIKHHLLSQVNGYDIFENSYEIKSSFMIGNKIKTLSYSCLERDLVSFDTSIPEGSIDYESDENEVCFIDVNSKVIKTIKSGRIGYANTFARSQFTNSPL